MVTTEIGGTKTIHVSGQVGWAQGASEPGADLAAQAEIAFRRVVQREFIGDDRREATATH